MEGKVIGLDRNWIKVWFSHRKWNGEKLRLGKVIIGGKLEGEVEAIKEEEIGYVAEISIHISKVVVFEDRGIGKVEKLKKEKEYAEKMIEYWEKKKFLKQIGLGDEIEVKWVEGEEDEAIERWKKRLEEIEKQLKEVE